MATTDPELLPPSPLDRVPPGRRRRRTVRRCAAAAIGALLLAAPVLVSCGDDDSSDDTTETTATGTGSVDSGGSETISVRAVDGSFEPSTITATAGSTVTIDFQNAGDSKHTFTIEELDVDEEVQPGGSTTVEVQVPQDGPVEFICRFHQSAGMTGTLEVVADAAGGNSTITEPTVGSDASDSDSSPAEDGTSPADGGGDGY